ncbi:GNAT family N-acetyltransferase [Salidesulfovibrio onnuriiensis]|uniref:GNAT family N-acetyltransferase n=1 Tax=Salidesulfovibrio onnuriiensis TaxID=2583823 RepID=UPI00202B163D|nr:GNAT family N-acetyltransferase [Salidesulfovibrio onnuriiensis]
MPNIELTFDIENIDWEHACTIFERAPLGTRKPDRLQKIFENSQLVCFAWDNGTLVGLARALSDQVAWSVIYDLCMFPEYQGQGLGKRMMRAMIERLDTPNVQLHSVPAMMGFYEKLGFRKMTTAMVLTADPERLERGGYII